MALQYFISHLVTIATASGAIFFSIHLFGTRRSSQSTLAWLLAFVFVPWGAIPLYLLIGTRKIATRKETKTRRPLSEEAPVRPIERVLWDSGIAPSTATNSFSILDNGERAYEKLLSLIHEAEHTIHITMFILGDDDTGKAMMDALCKRARDGIQVRVILDAVGSRGTWRRAARELATAGGMLLPFMPLLHWPTRGSTNLRSHRKLVVVDGTHVFTGGVNLAIEYMGPTPSPSRWRDIAAVASGPVAIAAEDLFASDWRFCGGKNESLAKTPREPKTAGSAFLQVVPSGPDRADDALYDALIVAIGSAKKRVAIVTPYYVPDEPLQRALELAARRGVTTELVVPQRSNHALADFARRSSLADLQKAGVHLYAYPKGMVHAKAMVADDDFAYVGSPNMDMRSLFLDYENALFIYDAPNVAKVAAYIDGLRDESDRDAMKTTQRFRVLEQIARLLAPEL